jgi:hypothetical protein
VVKVTSYLYNEYNKEDNIYQPQLSRSRQIYRGPRESQKQNLEQDQFLYDVAKLQQRILEAEALLLRMSSSLYYHSAAVPNTAAATPFFSASFYYDVNEQESTLTITDPVDLSSQISRLVAKIKRLENQEI